MQLLEELTYKQRILSTKHLLYLLCHQQFGSTAMSPTPSPGVLYSNTGNNSNGGEMQVTSRGKQQEDIRVAFQRAKEIRDLDSSMDVSEEVRGDSELNSSPTTSTTSTKENAEPARKKNRKSGSKRSVTVMTYTPKKKKRSVNSGSVSGTPNVGRRASSSRSSTTSEDVLSCSGSTVSSSRSSSVVGGRRGVRSAVEKGGVEGIEGVGKRGGDDGGSSVVSGSSGRSTRSSRKLAGDESGDMKVVEEDVGEEQSEVTEQGKTDKAGKEDESDESSSEDGDSDGEDSSDEERAGKGVYVVERIDDKRVIDGVDYYYIKWKGWHESSNTWEPIENLDGCTELLDEFHKRVAEKKSRRKSVAGGRKRRDSDDMDEVEKAVNECTDHMKSYTIMPEWPSDKEPLSVEGVILVDGILTYVVKRKVRLGSSKLDRSNAVLVHADSFRVKYPHLVINFYEKRVVWTEDAKSDEEKTYIAAQINLLRQNAGSFLGKLIANDLNKSVRDGVAGEEVETQVIEIQTEVEDEDVCNEETQVFGGERDDQFGLPDDMDDTDVSSSDPECGERDGRGELCDDSLERE